MTNAVKRVRIQVRTGATMSHCVGNIVALKGAFEMIKLSDFARRHGVTPRAVQRLVKKYESEISEHIEKKGQNGTWLDDEAQEFLRSKMKQNPVVIYGESADPLIEENQILRDEILELRKELSESYKRVADVLEDARATQFQLQTELAEQKLLSAGREEAEQKAAELELALTDSRKATEAAEKKASEAEAQAASIRKAKLDVELTLEAVKEEAETAEQIAEANEQEAERAKAEAEKLASELAELEQMTPWQFRKMKRAKKAIQKKQAREEKKKNRKK